MAKFLPWEYIESGKAIRVADGPTPNPKKITGTRLGAIMGVNKWKSIFDAWCEICRVAEEPFEDNKYTLAGKVIEPIMMEWCKENISPYIESPEEWFETSNVGYDFFPENPIFGGMWDALVLDSRVGDPVGIIEIKTSSRPQDWVMGVPDSYAAQALLYAALLDLERVFVAVAFLEPEDYVDPNAFVPKNGKNAFVYELRVSDHIIRGNTIDTWIDTVTSWWHSSVMTGVSPEFDERRDAKFLAILRKNEVQSEPLEILAKEAALLEAKIDSIKIDSGLTTLEKSLKDLKEQMKCAMMDLFTDNDEVVSAYGWKVKRSTKAEIDIAGLKRDGLFDSYSVIKTTYTMTRENN